MNGFAGMYEWQLVIESNYCGFHPSSDIFFFFQTGLIVHCSPCITDYFYHVKINNKVFLNRDI